MKSKIPYLWPPAALFAGIALYQVLFSLLDPWFTDRASYVFADLKLWVAVLSFAGCAVLAASSRVRAAVAGYLREADGLPWRAHALWLGAAYAGMLSLFLFLKYCQYRGFQLPMDTAMTASMAAHFLHRFALESTIYGVDYFAVHFQPLIALYSPFLLFTRSTFVLIAAQTAVIATMPVSVYVLVFNRTRSSVAAQAALWVSFTSPLMFEVLSNNLEASANLAAFFLAGMALAELRRWLPAAAMFVLALMSSEQAPLAFLGLGPYLVLTLGPRRKRSWLIGCAVSAAAIAVFAGEMLITYSYPKGQRLRDWALVYGHLGATPLLSLKSMVLHPLSFVSNLVWPPEKLLPLWRLLYTTGFSCLASPLTAIPWAVNFMPNFMGAPGTHLHGLVLHYAAQTVGPVWWASAAGVAAAQGLLRRKRLEAWLLLWALLIGGVNLINAPWMLVRHWGRPLFEQGPKVLSRIPPDASLWASEFLTAPVGCRDFIKALPYTRQPWFERRLFLPDYIVFSKDWVVAGHADFRRSVAGVIKSEGYAKVVETEKIVLLRHPGAPLAPGGKRPPPLTLPAPDETVDFKVRISARDRKALLLKLGGVKRGESSGIMELSEEE